LTEGAVGPVFVVMPGVLLKHGSGVPPVGDQEAVEELAAD
jgi:hypothetical protein